MDAKYFLYKRCIITVDHSWNALGFKKGVFCLQVKKIFENEKRLQAGDHSLDLLVLDFEKNYNMYVFPVHWQFGQLDQHPSDGYVLTGFSIRLL